MITTLFCGRPFIANRPIVLSASVDATGLILTINLNLNSSYLGYDRWPDGYTLLWPDGEELSWPLGSGVTVTADGTPVTLTYVSGNGTSAWVYNITNGNPSGNPILAGATVLLTVAAGVWVAALMTNAPLVDGPVTNNSEVTNEPTILTAVTNSAGTQITIGLSAAIVADVNTPILVADGVYNTLTYVSGAGTNTWVYSTATPIADDTVVLRLFAERCWKLDADDTPVASTSTPAVYDVPGAYTYTVPAGGTTAWYQCWGGGATGSAGTPGNGNHGGGGGGFSSGVGVFVAASQLRIAVGSSIYGSYVDPSLGTAVSVGIAFVGAWPGGVPTGGAGANGDVKYPGGSGAAGATTGQTGSFKGHGGGGGGGGGVVQGGNPGIPGSSSGSPDAGAGGRGFPSGGYGGGGGLFASAGSVGLAPGGGGGGGGAGGGGEFGGVGAPGMVRVLTGHFTVTNNVV